MFRGTVISIVLGGLLLSGCQSGTDADEVVDEVSEVEEVAKAAEVSEEASSPGQTVEGSVMAQGVSDAFGCDSLAPVENSSVPAGIEESRCEREGGEVLSVWAAETATVLDSWLIDGGLSVAYYTEGLVAAVAGAPGEEYGELELLLGPSAPKARAVESHWYPGGNDVDTNEYSANFYVSLQEIPGVDTPVPQGSPSPLAIWDSSETVQNFAYWSDEVFEAGVDPSFAVFMRSPTPTLKDREGENLVGTFFWEGRIYVVEFEYRDDGAWY